MTPTAMLLGAGYGTRLRPLTGFRPKPLVPVGNRPLLDWHLDALAELGISSLALNVSHLAEQIEDHVDGLPKGLPRLDLLREETPTGTGGGLLGARHLLEPENRFLVINTDIFHTIELGAMLDRHDRARADATLAVRRAGPKEPYDELTIDNDGTVRGNPEGERGAKWRFAGIHVLTPEVFDHLPASGSLRAGYEGLLARGAKIMAHDCSESTWFDVGTPAGYLAANCAAIPMASQSPQSLDGVKIIEPALIHRSAEIAAGCSIGPRAVIGEGASIGSGSQLSESVVWPKISIPPGSMLRGCVAYPGGVLAVADPA